MTIRDKVLIYKTIQGGVIYMNGQGKISRRILTTMLAAATAAAFMPFAGTAQNVYAAETGKAIQVNEGSVKGYNKTTKVFSYVYYGSIDLTNDSVDNPTPIKWRVLSMDGNGGTYKDSSGKAYSSKAMLMLSDEILDVIAFDKDNTANSGQTNPNEWQHSDAQSWCRTFYGNSLSGKEQSAVLTTSLAKDAVDVYLNSGLKDDTVFFLSALHGDDGYYGDLAAKYKGSKAGWWLRSARYRSSVSVAFIDGNGNIYPATVNQITGARPAFNLNLSDVLFSSAASDGKLSGSPGASALKEVKDYSGSEWKLTILDSKRDFNTGTVKADGRTLSVPYSGAAVGSNEYISAVVLRNNSKVTYYGRLAEAKASGTVDIALPDGYNVSTDKLYIFSEQYNGDKNTDYASKLSQVKVPASVTPSAAVFDKYKQADVSVSRTDNDCTFIKLVNGNSVLTQNKDYTINGNTVTISKSYLAGLADGDQTLTFEYSGCTDPTLTITVKDSRPAPSVKTQPTGGSYDINSKVVPLTVTSNDAGAKYQWQKSSDGNNWENIAGATGTSYTPPLTAGSSFRYRCVITVSTGLKTISKAVTVTVSGKYALGSTVTNGALVYKVTKQPAAGAAGTVHVVKAVKRTYKSISVPSSVTINGYKYNVTAIAAKAFYKNTKLKKLTIGSNVTAIGSKAAYGCKKLKTVTLKSKKIKKIGKAAFSKCRRGLKYKVPKAKYKAYKKMLKKSKVPKRSKYTKF